MKGLKWGHLWGLLELLAQLTLPILWLGSHLKVGESMKVVCIVSQSLVDAAQV
jgi:hypothetical protein